jgi:hypothetical protein
MMSGCGWQRQATTREDMEDVGGGMVVVVVVAVSLLEVSGPAIE